MPVLTTDEARSPARGGVRATAGSDGPWSWYRRTSVTSRLAVALIAAYLVLVAVNAAPIGNLHTGDTDMLVKGTRLALQCLKRGKLVGCGHTPGSPLSNVEPYALLQYLPAAVFVQMGLSDAQVVRALGSVNLAAMAAALVVVVLVARRLRPAIWAPVLVLALIGSSLTYQSTSGFGEMLAAFACLLAVAAVIWRRPVLIFVAMALATTGKETMFPFLLALGWLAGRSEDDRYLPPARVMVPMVAGILVGEFLNVGFDVFRFAADKNLTYLQPILFTPGLERKANFFAGLWVAPSSGTFWYWPVAVVVVVCVLVAAIVALARAPKRYLVWLPPLLAVLTLGAFMAGLSDWYTPFGWITYGPRLAVPILPAALVVILYTGGGLFAGALKWLLSRLSGVALCAGFVVVAGWPQFGAPWSWMPAVLRMEEAGNGCPALTQLIIQDGIAHYYHCAEIVMWRIHPAVLKTAATVGGGYAVAGRVLLGAASVVLVVDLAGRLRRPRHARSSHLPA